MSAALTAGPRRARLPQLDLVRLVPMAGVVLTHALIFTQPTASAAAGAVLMLLHVNREAFFFVTAFVLFYSTGAAGAAFSAPRLWRRRFPLVLAPYLAWTVAYWLLFDGGGRPWPPGPDFWELAQDLSEGWFHLYFLLVTMQFYLAFPLLAWLIRRTRGRHGWLLGGSGALQLALTAVIQYRYPSGTPLQPVFDRAQVLAPAYQFYFVAGGLAAAHLSGCQAWLERHRRPAVIGVLAILAAGEAWYAANLGLGEPPEQAAGVFQPVLLPLVGAVVVGLYLLGDRWVRLRPPDGRLWRGVGRAADHSFGVYLCHMLFLGTLLWPAVGGRLPLERLPGLLSAALVGTAALGLAVAFTALARRTPLSRLLTGRPRLVRPPAAVPAEPWEPPRGLPAAAG